MPATGNNHHITLTLSIRLSADGFCFIVCNPQDNSLIRMERFAVKAGESMSDRLLHELSKPEYFNHSIDQVFVLSSSPSTRIPIEEFRREEAQMLYELTFSNLDFSRIHVTYNILPRLEAVELYSIPRDIEDIIVQFYPTARYFGTNAMLLERLLHLEEESTSKDKRLYLCTLPEHLALFHFRDGALQYANTFKVGTVNDAVYMILYTWNTLKLNAEADHLITFTNEMPSTHSISNTSRLTKVLSDYIAHVETLTPAQLFPRIPIAHEKEIPVDLLALLLNRL